MSTEVQIRTLEREGVDFRSFALPARGLLPIPGVWLLVGIALVVVGLRWTVRSQFLFDLDSILYSRALDVFDLRLQQPALPGYFLYIELGRLVRALLSDPNLSLEFLSATFGALLPLALFALGREIFDTRTGVIASVLGLSGPVFWYQSSFASPRIAEGLLATTVVFLGVRYRKVGEVWAFWALPVVVGLAGGVRQQILLYLLPFCVWATWHASIRLRLGGAVVGGLMVLSWLVPTVLAAGGLDEYRLLSNQQWQAFVVNQTGLPYARDVHDLLSRAVENIGRIGLYTLFSCPLAALALLISWGSPRPSIRSVTGVTGQALLVASLPALFFFAIIHIQQIGHIMAVAPFMVICVARLLARRVHGPLPASLTALVVAANLLFVFFMPSRLLGDRIGTPTLAAIKERDAFISAAVTTIQAASPVSTVVITSPLAYGFGEQYTPGYQLLLLPGLFEPSSAPLSRDQRALSNGLQPIPSTQLPSAGTVLMPENARRFVMLAYDENIGRMLSPSPAIRLPDPSVPGISIVETAQPTAIRYQPGHLDFVPATSIGTGS